MGIRISKEKVSVVIMTSQYRMEGEIHVVTSGRLIDELNKERLFLPITNVTVYDAGGGSAPMDTVEFLAINVNSIIFIAPTSPMSSEGEEK